MCALAFFLLRRRGESVAFREILTPGLHRGKTVHVLCDDHLRATRDCGGVQGSGCLAAARAALFEQNLASAATTGDADADFADGAFEAIVGRIHFDFALEDEAEEAGHE